MKIIELLRKLGILRFGVKKYKYTSGKDMPAEALMDDIGNADKELRFDFDKMKKNKKKEQ